MYTPDVIMQISMHANFYVLQIVTALKAFVSLIPPKMGEGGIWQSLGELTKQNQCCGIMFSVGGPQISGGGQGGSLGVMGTGSVREVGEERAGDGLPKGTWVGRNRKWIMQHCTIFCNRKSTQRWEPLRKGAGTRSTRYGKQEIETPCPPPPTDQG